VGKTAHRAIRAAGSLARRVFNHPVSGIRNILAGPLRVAQQRNRLEAQAEWPGVIHNRHGIVDNFGTRPGAPENAPFLPFGQAKTALALV